MEQALWEWQEEQRASLGLKQQHQLLIAEFCKSSVQDNSQHFTVHEALISICHSSADSAKGRICFEEKEEAEAFKKSAFTVKKGSL